MSLTNNEDRSVVLWYMNGCIATFYQSDQEQQRKKVPVDTISFTNKAYLAFRKVNLLVKYLFVEQLHEKANFYK